MCVGGGKMGVEKGEGGAKAAERWGQWEPSKEAVAEAQETRRWEPLESEQESVRRKCERIP